MATFLTIVFVLLIIAVWRELAWRKRLEAELRQVRANHSTLRNTVTDLEKKLSQLTDASDQPETRPRYKIAAERAVSAEKVVSDLPAQTPPDDMQKEAAGESGPAREAKPGEADSLRTTAEASPAKPPEPETPPTEPKSAEPDVAPPETAPAKPPEPETPATASKPAEPDTPPATTPKPPEPRSPIPVTPPPSMPAPVKPKTAHPVPPAPPPQPPVPPQTTSPRRQFFTPGWEERFASRWLVWLGGIAIALAGFFLIKYAAEQGWLSPAFRCAAGVTAGAAIAFAGEWLRRRPLQIKIASVRPDYVPQALTAAGLFIAFSSVYLAYALYGILPPRITFVMLGAIAICGFGLSLLQGPYVAALGLAGAMLTPGLIATEAPSALSLFGYLLAITVASAAVLRYRNWWWLGLATVALDYFWVLSWIDLSFIPSDDVTVFVFIVSVAVIFGWLSWCQTSDDELDLLSGGPVSSAQGSAMLASGSGFFCLAFLVHKLDYTEHSFMGLALVSLAIIVLAKLRRRFEVLFLFVAAVVLVLCTVWTSRYVTMESLVGSTTLFRGADSGATHALETVSRLTSFTWIAGGLSIVFCAGGYWCLKGIRPLLLVGPAVMVPLVLMLLGYARFWSITDDTTWATVSLLYAAVMSIAAARWLPTASEPSMRIPVGLYASAGALGVSIALAFLFRDATLTVALSLQVLMIGWLSRRADFRVLRLFTLILAMVIVVRLTFNPFIFQYADTSVFGSQWIVIGFGLPACAFYLAAQMFRAKADDEIVMALESAALVFAIMLITYEIRLHIAGSMTSTRYELLEQSVQSISWLASAYALMRRHEVVPRFFTLWGSRILLTLAGAQLLGLQFLLSNPVVTAKPVSGAFPTDTLFLAYLLPALLLGVAARKLSAVGLGRFRDWAFGLVVLLAFTYATLEVRHLFQGPVVSLEHASLTELYCTSLVWLVLATVPGFFAYLHKEAGVRLGSLAIIGLAAVSVFGGHALVHNPALTGMPISGPPVFNSLLLGFAAPAVLFWIAARKSVVMHWEVLRALLAVLACLLVFFNATLEVRHLFQGPIIALHHLSLAELYLTTLVWTGLAVLPMFIPVLRRETGVKYSSLAVAGLAALFILGAHMLLENPALTGEAIAGIPIFNLLLPGFAIPATLFWVAARRSEYLGLEQFRDYMAGLACLLLFVYGTLEVRRLFQGEIITVEHLSLAELYTTTLTWFVLGCLTYGLWLIKPEKFVRLGAAAMVVAAFAMVLAGHVILFNPALTGEAIAGIPIFNLLLLGFAIPATLFWVAARRSASLKREQIGDSFAGLACLLFFIYGTLELRRLFQGEVITLHHLSLAELYTTTLAWFALGGLTYGLWRIQPERIARIAAAAMVGAAVAMVFVGHVILFNPVSTGEPVFGPAILNVLLLGFAIPALMLLLADRLSERLGLKKVRDYPMAAAYLLGLVYATLEARRWFHHPDLSYGMFTESEDYAYSAIWLAYALATLIAGMWLKRSLIRYAALAVLVMTVVKVFLWDMSGLGGLYRVASFLGLGLSLVGIGYLYQRYVFPVTAKHGTNGDTQPG